MTSPAILIAATSLLAFALISSDAHAAPKKLSTAEASWLGIYSSPSEITGYSSTTLSVEKGDDWQGNLVYRLLHYSDVSSSDSIEQPEQSGALMIDGNKIYVATAYGHYEKHHKAIIYGALTRYTRLRIKGQTVLMRDDALYAYQHKNKLYDYGILVRVADGNTGAFTLADAEHLSIKKLYLHRSRPWRDPFVNGVNAR